MAREDKLDLPDDLDALLRRTMSIDPSPAFLPRVRARIESQDPASPWSWRLLALAGVATAVVIAAVISPGVDVSGPPPPAPPHVARALPPALSTSPLAVAPSPVVRESVRTATRPARAAVRFARVAEMPRVIVDDRQRTAVDQMMRMVASGRITDEAFAHTVPSSMLPIEDRVMGIAVRPVAVSPIDSGGVLHMGAEPKQPPRPPEAGLSRP